MMKSKMMASGGAMKTKMMASGGAMPMKDGKPAFLNDGKGMAKGGMPAALAKHAAKKASVAHKGLAGGGMSKMMASGGGIQTQMAQSKGPTPAAPAAPAPSRARFGSARSAPPTAPAAPAPSRARFGSARSAPSMSNAISSFKAGNKDAGNTELKRLVGMKNGGSASKRADGIAQRGKTKAC